MDDRDGSSRQNLLDASLNAGFRFLIVSALLFAAFACYLIVPKLEAYWKNRGAVPAGGDLLIRTSHLLVNYSWLFAIALFLWWGSSMLPRQSRRSDSRD